jgi:Zn-dependent peptidase ImmA (M78 family)/DNA-binding XRE family transcriptional regulator
MAQVPVSGPVLAWARTFRGLSVADAAQRIGVNPETVDAYESGAEKPSIGLFEKIAQVYALPQATLFRKTPPQELPLPRDFRTFDGRTPEFSFDFRVSLSNIRTLQAALRAIIEEDDQALKPNLRKYRFNIDPSSAGEIERKALGVSHDRQLDWKSGDGFRHWRAIIESVGVAVHMQKFPLTDCRGYSLMEDDGSAAIVINKSDSTDNAKTFTLLHEYAHLLIRRPGISDLGNRNPVEAYCNKFAGALLLPVDLLKRVFPQWPAGRVDWASPVITAAATRLKVSSQALAIRLETLNKAVPGFNRKFVFKPHPAKSGRVAFVTRRLNEIGGRLTTSVVSALDREVIDVVHASEALGLRPSYIEDARRYSNKQTDLASA